MTAHPPKKSDLGVRVLSAIVMVAVAGAALWLGGTVWAVFVAMVAVGVYYEWAQLMRGFENRTSRRLLWMIGGFIYLALASFILLKLRIGPGGIEATLTVLGTVIAIDIGAYFAGRTFGGPKIAPKISPSKTWAGLFGGMAGAFVALWFNFTQIGSWDATQGKLFGFLAILAPVAAIIAQAGDFFESWMKRRAGVKDSGNLIPGHGGLFDRTDGMISVLFVLGLLSLHSFVTAA